MTNRRAVASLAVATIASRLVGFLRIIVVAALLGTTALGNTFQSTNAVSNILFDLLAAGALSAALVPQLVKKLQTSNDEFQKLVSSLTTIVIIGLGAIALIGVILSPQISQVVFSHAPKSTRQEQIDLGTTLLRFFIPQVVLYGLGAVAVAALIAKKKFIAQVIAPIGGSIFIMVALYVFTVIHGSTSIYLTPGETILLGIAGTGACIAFVSIPIYVAFKNKIYLKFTTKLTDGVGAIKTSVWAVSIQAAAALLLLMVVYIGNNVDGAVVAYQLAFVFFLAPYAIISQSFSTVLLPDLSENSEDQSTDNFKNMVSNMMTWTFRPMYVSTALCIALCIPLTLLVTQGRASEGQNLVEVAFLTLVIGIVPYSIYQAASRVFFTLGNIKFPALTIFISSAFFVASAIVLSDYFHGSALVAIMGLSHTVAYLVAAVILMFALKKHGYQVFPNKTTILVGLVSLGIAVGGFYISTLFDLETRIQAFLYCSVFTAIIAIALVVFGGKGLRSKIKMLITQSRTSNPQTSDPHDLELAP